MIGLLKCLGVLVVYVTVIVTLIYSPQWKGKRIAWGGVKRLAGRLWQRVTRVVTTDHAAALLFLVSLIFATRYFFQADRPSLAGLLDEFYANLSAEFLSIAITVFVIDRLNQRRQESQLKAQLIRELRGMSNDFALRAADELYHQGWLKDGTLQQLDLTGANLKKAILKKANLRGVNLRWCNLERAMLRDVDLENANLRKANMRLANLKDANLKGVNLSLANLEDAYLAGANIQGANLSQVIMIGAEVTLEQLIEVQTLSGATMPDGRKYEEWIENPKLPVVTPYGEWILKPGQETED